MPRPTAPPVSARQWQIGEKTGKIENAVLRRNAASYEGPSRHCVLQQSLRFAGEPRYKKYESRSPLWRSIRKGTKTSYNRTHSCFERARLYPLLSIAKFRRLFSDLKASGIGQDVRVPPSQ